VTGATPWGVAQRKERSRAFTNWKHSGQKPQRKLAGVLTNVGTMPIHSLRSPVESHRALARRNKVLALGILLAIGIATALAFLFSS